MKKFSTLLLALLGTGAPAFAQNTFDGFYVGPTLHSAIEQHSISHPIAGHSVGEDHKETHHQVAAVLGYGKTLPLEDFPLYLGLEAYIPLQGAKANKEIESLINGVRSRHKHEMKTIFPKEGALKIGVPIDEKVLLFGKIGMVHQKVTHKIAALNHSAERSGVTPLFGAGLSFAVNGKWLINGEYTTFKTEEHKKLLFGHKVNHQRFQVTVAYRF